MGEACVMDNTPTNRLHVMGELYKEGYLSDYLQTVRLGTAHVQGRLNFKPFRAILESGCVGSIPQRHHR